ncbi:chaperonin 10-like protein [Mycena latifolia]|nr:chaperonin 10-like protein [Mycena latifolia]
MTPKTMLAAVNEPGNERLVLDKNYPIRELKGNETLLKVAAARVCHSDVLLLSGIAVDTRKYILGHEACGIPVKMGAKVDNHTVQIGKLYSILTLDSCVHGLNDDPALFNSLGSRDGAYAEYIIATADNLRLSFPRVKSGEKVLIFGTGAWAILQFNMPNISVQLYYACDLNPAARKLSVELGATEAFDLIELTNKTAAGFTVDTTIDFVANNQTFNLAKAALKGNAVNFPSQPKCVMVGVSAENIVFGTLDILTTGVQILGSTYGKCSDLVTVLDLFAKGTVRAHVHAEPLADINKIIDELRAFEITGRKVLIPHLKA